MSEVATILGRKVKDLTDEERNHPAVKAWMEIAKKMKDEEKKREVFRKRNNMCPCCHGNRYGAKKTLTIEIDIGKLGKGKNKDKNLSEALHNLSLGAKVFWAGERAMALNNGKVVGSMSSQICFYNY